MLELLISCVTMLVIYIILFIMIPYCKGFKGGVNIFQILLFFLLYADIFYKKNELWKNPEVYQQFHKTEFYPIINIKAIYSSDGMFKNFKYKKSDGLFSILNKDIYNKECIENYFIKEDNECPITDIIIEKQKKDIYQGYIELKVSDEMYIYYTNEKKLDGKLYEYAFISNGNCSNENVFKINNNCFQIYFYSNFDYLNSTSIKKKEEINFSNPFKKLKDFCKYSDVICLSFLIISFIYTLNEPYKNKKFNYFKIISLFLLLIVAILFLVRYIKFIKIKKFYNDNESTYKKDKNNDDEDSYFPRKVFNLDSIPFSMSFCSLIILLVYFITPDKCHLSVCKGIIESYDETYPLFYHKGENEKRVYRINYLFLPISIIYVVIFILDIVNDINIKNDYKKINSGIIYNWESNPIKSIYLSPDKDYQLGNLNFINYNDYSRYNDSNYKWKNNFLKIEKINNYDYFNIYSNINGKICGKDNQNNDLYFPENEECPINDIFISKEDKTIENYTKIYLGDNNGYLYYTNHNIKGKIIIDIKIGCHRGFHLNLSETNELCEYLKEKNFLEVFRGCNIYDKNITTPFYEKLDVIDACELYQQKDFCKTKYLNYSSYPIIGLYSINYQGINTFKTQDREKINIFRENMDKYIKLLTFKYILGPFNLIIYILFNYILLKEGAIYPYILCLLIIIIPVIIIYIIICGILVNININYIKNFLNVINIDFERNNNDSFWTILLLIIGIYFLIYDILVILYRFLFKDKNICQYIINKRPKEKKKEKNNIGNDNYENGISSKDVFTEKNKNYEKSEERQKENILKLNKEKENIKKEEKRICVVCMERESILIFVPCDHRCVCKICYNNEIQTCPVCRKTITNVLDRIYDV